MEAKLALLAGMVVLAFVGEMVRAASCGNGLYVNGGVSDNMDEKVKGIPWGQSWESNCASCGLWLQQSGLIYPGWYCEKDSWSTGIWLKGCMKKGGWACIKPPPAPGPGH
ncbi:hypothetical protein RvY_02692 [Ramazzottius varieornatus]|uniref:Uncharacterized protein n=1 Tax=Ramazzottius varieornatus TaxID=947166 RepID=A0A1D1UPC8_RAMVA|nr:hypothetical protein RvY_02692 [Ramazzottius varieornatus]